MKPEDRERKKPVGFDPHPPGSKHKMMAERSKVTKQKKKDKERMKKVRETARNVVTGEEKAEETPTEMGDAAPEGKKKD